MPTALTVLIYFGLSVLAAMLLLRMLASALGSMLSASQHGAGARASSSSSSATYATKAQIADYHRSVYQATGESAPIYFRRLESEARQHRVKYSNYYEDTAVLSNVPGGWAANHLSDRDRAVLDQYKIY